MSTYKQRGNQQVSSRHYSTKDVIRLFVIYWLIVFMLVVLGLFSIGYLIPGWAQILMYLSSLALAGIATYVHVSPGHKGKIDKRAIDHLADELK